MDEFSEYEWDVLDLYLGGTTRPSRICELLQAAVRYEETEALLKSAKFLAKVWECKQDMAAAAQHYFKRKALWAAREMQALANSDDKRVKFQALKDVLDRAGTAGTDKLELTSPKAYRDAVKDLLEDEPVHEEKP